MTEWKNMLGFARPNTCERCAPECAITVNHEQQLDYFILLYDESGNYAFSDSNQTANG